MGQTFEDSHFKWTVPYRDTTLRDCDELIGKVDHCLRDNPGYMDIEAALFKSFLYVAHWRKANNKKSREAQKCLDIAFNKIDNCQNDDARNGYSIVWHTLYRQIECNQGIESRAEGHGNSISAIKKTPECNAFIDATRAFLLSFLGPEREEESLRYYSQALAVYPNNIDWLFGYAHSLGRKARRERDKEKLENEQHVYEKILEKDPKHARAMVFLAQIKFHQGVEKPRVIKRMFNEALELAQKNSHSHTKVAVRVARFYRLTYNYKRALDILNDAEYSIGKDPNEMFFHQKAMVYLTKYKKYDYLRGFAKEYLLVGEEEGDKKSLLQESLIHLNEAVKRCDSGGTFGLDRAYVYEQLGRYEKADDEYISLMDASQEFHNQGRFSLYVKYGLYLKRRGNVELMMNYLSKAIEIFKSKIYSSSIDGEIYWAMSFYDRTNANNTCPSNHANTVNVRAEALYRLGWLRLLFSDVTLEKWQQSALSKNNPKRITHLQLYEQAYDAIENPTPGFLSDIIDGLIICHLKEGRKENLSKAESLIHKLHYYNRNSASEKLADLKLAQCEQSFGRERSRLLSEAVQEGSLDACERLCKWFESKTCPSLDPDVLRYCVQIQNCLSRDKLMYRQCKSLGGLFLHTLIDPADMNNSEIDRKKSVLRSINNIVKPRDDELDELREVYLRLLDSMEAKVDESVIIKHCSKVIFCARIALAHVVASFQNRFCSWYALKHAKSKDSDKSDSVEFRIVKAAPYINENIVKRGGVTRIVTTLKEAVQNELRGMLEKESPKKRPMPGFSLRFTDLFEYLTSIQPAANPDGSYDWIIAVNSMTNKYRHEENQRQIEYTVIVGKDKKGDTRRTFNIEDLAQTARFGVEKINMEFMKAEKKFDMYRTALRFAGWKSLHVNRYREMEGISI